MGFVTSRLPPRCDTRGARHASGISPTATFGRLIIGCCRASGIEPLARKVVRPTTLNVSIARSANLSLGEKDPVFLEKARKPHWCNRRTLFTTTMHPYMCRTTPGNTNQEILSQTIAASSKVFTTFEKRRRRGTRKLYLGSSLVIAVLIVCHQGSMGWK